MSELDILRRLLLKTPGSHFHFCVERYLKNVRHAQFRAELFIGEFESTPKIAELLRAFYFDSSYSVFKKSLIQLSDEVVKSKLINSQTSYKDLADLSGFVSLNYVKGLLSFFDADDLQGSKKARFTFLFKLLEPIFLMPRSSISISKGDFARVKSQFLGYTCHPSENILRYLDGELLCIEIDDCWLIREIRKSL